MLLDLRVQCHTASDWSFYNKEDTFSRKGFTFGRQALLQMCIVSMERICLTYSHYFQITVVIQYFLSKVHLKQSHKFCHINLTSSKQHNGSLECVHEEHYCLTRQSQFLILWNFTHTFNNGHGNIGNHMHKKTTAIAHLAVLPMEKSMTFQIFFEAEPARFSTSTDQLWINFFPFHNLDL